MYIFWVSFSESRQNVMNAKHSLVSVINNADQSKATRVCTSVHIRKEWGQGHSWTRNFPVFETISYDYN